jgi:hypothetical protein
MGAKSMPAASYTSSNRSNYTISNGFLVLKKSGSYSTREIGTKNNIGVA